ncbi:Shedu anti-phage system protein SduA domain-containing protein [Nocardia sp. NPDC056100]|uniref:Shedu anti-phage system protein SduA domain-containing protein n=1 Tax=Nocardia sp. NPDC056100 TaxID=3345712 RepID=UPI0035DC4DFF
MTNDVLEAELTTFTEKHGFTGISALAVGLLVTDRARELGFPLNPDALLTPGGGQVSHLGGKRVPRLLASHGINRELPTEGGRTSRGTLRMMRDYVDMLNTLHTAGPVDLDSVEEFWIQRFRDHFASVPLESEGNASNDSSEPAGSDDPSSRLLELIEGSGIDPQSLADAMVRHPNADQVISLLASSAAGMSAAQAAVLDQRRDLVAKLRELINDPTSTETDVQKLIGNAYWIFGGRYVGVAERRSFTVLDQTDIPLLGSDRTLHIVELKGPNIKKLIVFHRNHWIAGPKVHEAVAQAMNYLRSFDEQGLQNSAAFSNELGQTYDMSRVFATVVLGHSDHGRPDAVTPREVVTRTLRQYSAGLSRIEVITYDQLVENAERALLFEHVTQNQAAAVAETSEDSTVT